MKNWILAARPKTLSAAWVPVLVATALFSKATGNFSISIFACTMAASLLIQIATNFFNDAVDFKKGADTATRLGPNRMTQLGLISPEKMLRAGVAMLLLAAAFGGYLVLRAGVEILIVGIISGALAYGYTGGPWPLAYKGLGEIFVLIFFGFISVFGAYWVQLKAFTNNESLFVNVIFWNLIFASLQIGLLAVVLIAINNLRDVNQDKLSNKGTLAVRWGERFARIEIAFCLFVPFALCFFQRVSLNSDFALLPLLTFPLLLAILRGLWSQAPGRIYNKYLAMAGALHTAFGVLLFFGFALS